MGRVPRLSATLRRVLLRLGVVAGSARQQAFSTTIASLARASTLPGPADQETRFAPGRAFVRRVPGQNLWLLYRFDDTHVDILTVRDAPPVPHEDEG